MRSPSEVFFLFFIVAIRGGKDEIRLPGVGEQSRSLPLVFLHREAHRKVVKKKVNLTLDPELWQSFRIECLLGHASVQTTLDRYGHLLPATHKGAAQRLDLTLFGPSISKPLANGSVVGVTHNGESPEVLVTSGLS
jgi:hypothetical protein